MHDSTSADRPRLSSELRWTTYVLSVLKILPPLGTLPVAVTHPQAIERFVVNFLGEIGLDAEWLVAVGWVLTVVVLAALVVAVFLQFVSALKHNSSRLVTVAKFLTGFDALVLVVLIIAREPPYLIVIFGGAQLVVFFMARLANLQQVGSG